MLESEQNGMICLDFADALLGILYFASLGIRRVQLSEVLELFKIVRKRNWRHLDVHDLQVDAGLAFVMGAFYQLQRLDTQLFGRLVLLHFLLL